jgi:hypothetical protein
VCVAQAWRGLGHRQPALSPLAWCPLAWCGAWLTARAGAPWLRPQVDALQPGLLGPTKQAFACRYCDGRLVPWRPAQGFRGRCGGKGAAGRRRAAWRAGMRAGGRGLALRWLALVRHVFPADHTAARVAAAAAAGTAAARPGAGWIRLVGWGGAGLHMGCEAGQDGLGC